MESKAGCSRHCHHRGVGASWGLRSPVWSPRSCLGSHCSSLEKSQLSHTHSLPCLQASVCHPILIRRELIRGFANERKQAGRATGSSSSVPSAFFSFQGSPAFQSSEPRASPRQQHVNLAPCSGRLKPPWGVSRCKRGWPAGLGCVLFW